MEGATGSANERLATYGTLAPGRVNHHELADLDGTWHEGTVKGHLREAGWGADYGYPGLILDPSGPAVDIFIFESAELPDHWSRLDAFEGSGYRRVIIKAETANGPADVSIYVLNV